jgi:hypothetical protein
MLGFLEGSSAGNSARSRGGSKCVHLPVAISNVLTTFLSVEMKQSVCGSGWAAATSLAWVSNCLSRCAIVRVSGASLPEQTSRPTPLEVGAYLFYVLRGRGKPPSSVCRIRSGALRYNRSPDALNGFCNGTAPLRWRRRALQVAPDGERRFGSGRLTEQLPGRATAYLIDHTA